MPVVIFETAVEGMKPVNLGTTNDTTNYTYMKHQYHQTTLIPNKPLCRIDHKNPMPNGPLYRMYQVPIYQSHFTILNILDLH